MFLDEKSFNPTEQVPHFQTKTTKSKGKSKFNSINAQPTLKILEQILAELRPIDFRETGKLTQRDSLKKSDEVVITVDCVLSAARALNYDLCFVENAIFGFNGQYWQQFSREAFGPFLTDAATRLGISEISAVHYKYQGELMQQFISTASRTRPPARPGLILINLRNGTFEVSSKGAQFREFRKQDFLTYQLPFEFHEDAKSPKWQRFLDEVLPDKSSQYVLAEFFGYVLTDLKLERALFLYGTGANGKSVVYDVMRALYGPENVTSAGLSELKHEYTRAALANKLLNYSSESARHFDSEIFKKMASGEAITARLPYGNPFEMTRYPKLAFNCNRLPHNPEPGEAYYRRLILIPLLHTVPVDRRDPTLAKKIIEKELAGVFNWMFLGLQRLIRNKKFSDSVQIADLLNTYQNETDPVAEFVEDFSFVKSFERSEATRLDDLFKQYRDFCLESGYSVISRTELRRRLNTLGFSNFKGPRGQMLLGKTVVRD